MNCLLCNNTIDFKLNIKWILSLEKYKRDNVCKRCREELGKCKIDNACEGCGREQKKLLLCNDCIKWKNNNKILLNNKSIYTYDNLIIKKYFERYKFMGDYYWRKIFNIEFKNFITNNYPSKDWIYIPIPVDEYTMQHRGFNQVEGLVIDVRDNPGGYLSEVKNILSLFLNKKQVLYQLQTKNKTEKVYGTKKSVDRDYPVSVIINDESASASEILASAFKESYGSHIVGINSYGKGTVQSASDLNSGDTIKYTVQKWLTPDGNWVNDKGVVPTDRVETVLKEGETLTYDNDTMLQTAISVVSE